MMAHPHEAPDWPEAPTERIVPPDDDTEEEYWTCRSTICDDPTCTQPKRAAADLPNAGIKPGI